MQYRKLHRTYLYDVTKLKLFTHNTITICDSISISMIRMHLFIMYSISYTVKLYIKRLCVEDSIVNKYYKCYNNLKF